MKAMGLERRVAELETIVRAAFKVSARTIACRVYDDAAQTLTNNVLTAIAFAHERWDTHELHDTVTNNSHIYAPAAGWYQIWGGLEYAAHATGSRDANIRLNGSTYIATNRVPSSGGSLRTRLDVSTIYYLAAGNYVELVGFQDSGGDLNTFIGANSSPEFAIVRIGG